MRAVSNKTRIETKRREYEKDRRKGMRAVSNKTRIETVFLSILWPSAEGV